VNKFGRWKVSVLNASSYFFIAVGLQDILETKIWYNDVEKSLSKDFFYYQYTG